MEWSGKRHVYGYEEMMNIATSDDIPECAFLKGVPVTDLETVSHFGAIWLKRGRLQTTQILVAGPVRNVEIQTDWGGGKLGRQMHDNFTLTATVT